MQILLLFASDDKGQNKCLFDMHTEHCCSYETYQRVRCGVVSASEQSAGNTAEFHTGTLVHVADSHLYNKQPALQLTVQVP